jgi:alpha-1,3-mannosyltransferase
VTAPFSHRAAPALPAGTRVIHVVRQFLPNRGGLEDVVANLCRAQLALGLKPSVVTLDRLFSRPELVLPASEVIDGIPITRIPFRGSTRYPLAPEVFKHLREADLVHVHAIDFFFDALALGWLLHRKPLVATTHGGFFHTSDFAGLKKLWFNGPTRLSAQVYRGIAGCSTNDARMFERLAPGKVRVIENGVDLDKFAGASSPDPQRRLVSIGRFSKNKRPDRLIATMAALAPARSILASRHARRRLGLDRRSAAQGDRRRRHGAERHPSSRPRRCRGKAGDEPRLALRLRLGVRGFRPCPGRGDERRPSAGRPAQCGFAGLASKFPVVRTVDFADAEEAALAVEQAHADLVRYPGNTRPRLSNLASYSWHEVARRYLEFYIAAL